MTHTEAAPGAQRSDARACICLFSALYAPSMGGVETYTESLAGALARTGRRVVVVTMATHGGAGLSQGEGGVEVVRLPCRSALGGRWPLPQRNGEYRRLWGWLGAQDVRFVVVNTRFYPLSCAGLAFARGRGIAPVLVEHGSAHLTMGSPLVDKGVEAVEHAMTVRCKRRRPHCYAVSRKASAWLSHFGIESCGELPNAIDADAYAAGASGRDFRAELGIPQDAFVAASAGRLVPEKGPLALAQAVAQLAGEGAGPAAAGGTGAVHAVIAGAGPQEGAIAALACPNVHLVGRLARPDLAALLVQADALCLPSRSEGFATTLLEAAACGTPAIVTDVGGTDELIPDARFGTVIPDAAPATVACALRDAAADRTRTAEQGRRAAARVRELCSWERTASLTIAACEAAQRG